MLSGKLRRFVLPRIRYASTSYNVGDVIHGYKLEKVDHIKELNIKPYYLRHEATGAEHLHVQKDGDSNNVFAISLRTTPTNSTGVAHILEHLSLCGSKKYPVRDPFFKMLTRSLATFMNAMTAPDCTFYPFSTQNEKDFENLMRVYIDAVFFPRLRAVDFRQEGWRLEHEKPDKKDTPITIKGVVYNEMKGVFSSSASIYGRHMLNNLFPDTTYRYESGGDPEQIPLLSHEELKKFHQVHYHPSNAKFFTYGDLPLDNHLKLINELVLTKFSENPQAREQSAVTEQELWDKPRTIQISCPSDPLCATPDKQTTTSISYVLPAIITDLEEMFSLQLLSNLLTDGPNAPFYKNLIESGLGSDYSPSSGFGNFTKQPYFSIGLQNISKNDIEKVHEIIENTFIEAAEKGFPQERIDAALHSIELGLKHISGNFGLRLMMSMYSAWNHDGDMIDYLRVNKYVDMFRQTLQRDKKFWSKLINKYFLKNNHKLILNMDPVADFESKRKEREQNLLDSKISNLNDVDLKTVLYEGMELMKIHNIKDDVSALPCLEPSKDISKDLSYKTELKFDSYKGVKLQLCEQPTNEVVYFRAITNLNDKKLALDLIDYLPLFCDVSTKLGAGKYNRHEFYQKMQLGTGGLSVSMLLNPSLEQFDIFNNDIFLSSYCLKRNVNSMFDLWISVYNQIHFQDNKEYLHQLIKASAAELSEGISHMGQMYAMKRASSSLSNLNRIDERLSGLTYVAKMRDIASKEPVESIASKLQALANTVLDPFNIRCAINAEPEAMESTNKAISTFIDEAQNFDYSLNTSDIKSHQSLEVTKEEDIKFPFATHYVAKSLITVPRLHEDFAKLVIMSKLISSKYLHREVREKGGAYGVGARMSVSGVLNFFSARDPNTTKTMETFDRCADWIADGEEYSQKDIEESKLGIFQDVDRPVEPGRRGLNYFTQGETDEMRQEYRRRLLSVTLDDVVEVADKYLKQENVGRYTI